MLKGKAPSCGIQVPPLSVAWLPSKPFSSPHPVFVDKVVPACQLQYPWYYSKLFYKAKKLPPPLPIPYLSMQVYNIETCKQMWSGLNLGGTKL